MSKRKKKNGRGKHGRDKGRKFELWTRLFISKMFNFPIDAVLVRSRSAPGSDVRVADFYRQDFPFAVECKYQKNLSFWKAVGQAVENAKNEKLIPLLFLRHMKLGYWVAMPAELFVALAQKISFQDMADGKILMEIRNEFPLVSEAKLDFLKEVDESFDYKIQPIPEKEFDKKENGFVGRRRKSAKSRGSKH